jgi:hypothetical protein
MAVSDVNIDLVKPEDVMFNVSMKLNDPKFRKGLSKGWYKQQIRDAFDALDFSSKFRTMHADFPTTDIVNGKIEMPPGVVDLKEVYVFNEDECHNITNVARVWSKRRYNNQPTGSGYTAHQTELTQPWDDWFGQTYSYIGSYAIMTMSWGNVQSGFLMVNNNVMGWNKIRFVYAGTHGAYETVPCIPRFMVKYVQDWLTYNAAMGYAIRFPREGYSAIAKQAYSELYDEKEASFYNCKKLVGELTEWQMSDNDTYSERPNW